jgi:hypothetical protein
VQYKIVALRPLSFSPKSPAGCDAGKAEMMRIGGDFQRPHCLQLRRE